MIFAIIKTEPGRIQSSLLSFATVLVYFLSSIFIIKFQGSSSFSFMILAQFSYIIKLLFTALLLIVVFKFFGNQLDRQWYGISTILIASAWLAGEIRGFFKIRFILDSN
jgi:hypothetical protein